MEREYYYPSKATVQFLERELQSLEVNPAATTAGEDKQVIYRRKRDRRGNIAKNKFDFMRRIFQSLTDIIYFLEFIENHRELHDIYEKDLKDLFGFNDTDPDIDEFNYQNRGGPIERLIRASLLIDIDKPKKIDFRMQLTRILIVYSIQAILHDLEDDRERSIISSDTDRIWLWGDLLQSRIKDRAESARRRLGFYPYKYDPLNN